MWIILEALTYLDAGSISFRGARLPRRFGGRSWFARSLPFKGFRRIDMHSLRPLRLQSCSDRRSQHLLLQLIQVLNPFSILIRPQLFGSISYMYLRLNSLSQLISILLFERLSFPLDQFSGVELLVLLHCGRDVALEASTCKRPKG